MSQGSIYLKLALVSMVSVVLAVVFYFLEKKTKFGNIKKVPRQVIIGVFFGLASILGTEAAVNLGGYLINVRDAAPILASFVFGPISGIIAGFMGGIERWFAALWGAGMYTRLACTLSTMFAGLISAFFKQAMYNDERPKWYNGVVAALVVETFHMTMVFITNISDPHKAFEVVANVIGPMMIVNAFAVGVGTLAIWLLDRKNRVVHEKRDISSYFRQFMIIAIALAYIASTTFILVLQTNQAKSDAASLISMNLTDVENDVKESADKTLLDLTRRITAELDSYEKLNDKKKQLSILAERYGVDEVSVISGGGTIIASTEPKYVGFYMGSGAQAAEFMEVINGEVESYVQEYQPITYESSQAMKYAAVKSGYYTTQVGISGDTLEQEISKQTSGITHNRHIGNGGSIVIADPYWNVVSSPKGGEGLNISATGIEVDTATISEGALFETSYYGDDCYATYAVSEGYYIVGLILRTDAMFSRNMVSLLTVFMEVLTFAILFVITYFLVRRLVVDNVHTANYALRKVSSGDLDFELQPYPIAEFDELATDVNHTVSTLKGYIAEAAARIDKDLQLAKEIQANALPSIFPPYPNEKAFDIYATMDPAKEVGGDFYDFYYVGGRKFAFLVADVSGKGVPAAMFMMTSKTLLKGLAETGIKTSQIIEQANNELCANNDAGMFVTCWLGIIDLDTGHLQYTNAGHNPPVLKRADGKYEYLKGKVNLVLAGMEGMPYDFEELTLDPGDKIFLYTDGVTEATDINMQLFGEERLLSALNQKEYDLPDEVCREVRKSIDEFVGEAEQFDDITMLAFNYHGKPVPNNGELKVSKVEELTIEATTENIGKATLFVDEILDRYDCPIKAQTQIDIALDELLSNIAFYAYNPDVGPATISVEVEEDPLRVVISFIDNGIPYDPLKKEDPNTNTPIEERDVGGLGIFMVKQTMDEIAYEYKDGQNILTIKKNIE